MNNLILFILISLALGFVLCLITGTKRPWVAQVAYAAAILTSLVTASKLSPISEGVYVSVAIGLYSMTFLLTDYLGEIFGKKESFQAVAMAFVGAIILVIGIQLAILAPAAPFWPNQEAYATVLGAAPRLLFASILAFVAAQLADVFIFHKLKEKTSGGHLYIRNNVSTFVGQTIDSAVFFGIAFYGLVPDLVSLIVTACIVKYIIAIIDTPFLYLARSVALRSRVE